MKILFILLLCAFKEAVGLNVTIIGTGYVGLVTSAYLAEMHQVTAYDIDQKKIATLKRGTCPLFEPDLPELIQKNQHNLRFSTSLEEALSEAEVVMIAVGTPSLPDGSVDTRILMSAVQEIAQRLTHPAAIIIKSTVPVGTLKKVEDLFAAKNSHHVVFISNPEFLREGCSVYDIKHPDRIVIGTRSDRGMAIAKQLYNDALERNIPFIFTTPESAEMIKYASNAFLALKVSYANEIGRLCRATGANMQEVTTGVGLDHRINKHFLNQGPGFGGSCFPKDVRGIVALAENYGVELTLIPSILTANQTQKEYVCSLVRTALGGSCKQKTIAVLGIAFKANTDDIRESAALDIIDLLSKEEAMVRVYDPVARMPFIRENITECSSWQEALRGADALVVLTEWPEFKALPTDTVCELMRNPTIIDTRSILQLENQRNCFTYSNAQSQAMAR